jgi:ABC-2 type transport system permease protein/sodium transport system permease protein
MPLLLYPLLSVAFLQFAWLGKSHAERGTSYICGFASRAEAELFFYRLERGRRDRDEGKLEAAVGSAEELEHELREGAVDLVVRIPGAEQIVAPEEDIRRGMAALRLEHHDWQFRCELLFLAGSPAGQGALTIVERRLAAANEADLLERLNVPGAAQRVVLLRPAIVAVKGEEADTFTSLAALVPLVLIMMTVTGAVYPAIDLTAGERERGTLEILVAAPVPRFSLLTAKYLAVVTVAVLTALVNLVSMTITLQVSGLGKQLFGSTDLSPQVIAQMLGLLLLFAAFFSAVLLSLTSFARSFKEAQAYLIPLMLGSLAPGVMAMIPGLTLRPEFAVLPLVNIVLLARDLFKGGADPVMALVVVTTTLLYAVAALSLAARVFGAESVLYSEQSGWSDLWRRPTEPTSAPTIASALWCLALAVPVYFLVQSKLAQMELPEPVLLVVVAALSVLLFAGLPIAAAYLGRVPWPAGFGLRAPRPTAILAGLVLGVSLWPLVLRFLEHSTTNEDRPEQMAEAIERARQAGALLMITTIVAAIAEEFYFRGYLFAALRARSGPLLTIGVSAVLFGVAHVFLGGALGMQRLLPSAALGVVLGLVAWVSGSVVPGLLLHVCHNSVLVMLLLGRYSEGAVPWTWVAAGALGTVAGFGLLLIGRRRAIPLAG